jgi:hypothetical protein
MFWTFYFAILGFEIKASNLQGSHLSHSTSPFGVGYFWNRVSLYVWSGLDSNSPVCISCIAGWSVPPCLAFSVEMGSRELFCLFRPQCLILPISTSLIAGMTTLNHCTQLIFTFFTHVLLSWLLRQKNVLFLKYLHSIVYNHYWYDMRPYILLVTLIIMTLYL